MISEEDLKEGHIYTSIFKGKETRRQITSIKKHVISFIRPESSKTKIDFVTKEEFIKWANRRKNPYP